MNQTNDTWLIPFVMGLLISVFFVSGAIAEPDCFDGPHLDHQDKANAYWVYTNHCSGAVTIEYRIETEEGNTETGTACVEASEDGSFIDMKGRYKFNIVAPDQGQRRLCASKAGQDERDASADLSGKNAGNFPMRAIARHGLEGVPDSQSSGRYGETRRSFDAANSGYAEEAAIDARLGQLGDAAGANRCWRQKINGGAKLVCCASVLLCERFCRQTLRKGVNDSCASACAGAAEQSLPGTSCYWLH